MAKEKITTLICAEEVNERFDELLDASTDRPDLIANQNEVVALMVSPLAYESMLKKIRDLEDRLSSLEARFHSAE